VAHRGRLATAEGCWNAMRGELCPKTLILARRTMLPHRRGLRQPSRQRAGLKMPYHHRGAEIDVAAASLSPFRAHLGPNLP
jgi:hypothetical protein